MELLFVALGGAVLGIIARYALPGRGAHGAALVPAVGTVAAVAAWVALTWSGWTWDGGWIWWVSLGVAALASVVVGMAVARSRTAGDHRMLHELMRNGHPNRA